MFSHIALALNRPKAPMGLFKPDFYRFFAFGFLAGAVLVGVTMESPVRDELVSGVVPVAEAAPAQ